MRFHSDGRWRLLCTIRCRSPDCEVQNCLCPLQKTVAGDCSKFASDGFPSRANTISEFLMEWRRADHRRSIGPRAAQAQKLRHEPPQPNGQAICSSALWFCALIRPVSGRMTRRPMSGTPNASCRRHSPAPHKTRTYQCLHTGRAESAVNRGQFAPLCLRPRNYSQYGSTVCEPKLGSCPGRPHRRRS